MIPIIANLLVKYAGFKSFDFAAKLVRWATFILFVVLAIVGGSLLFRACNRPPTLDEPEIRKGQEVIEKKNRKEMIDFLAEVDAKQEAVDAPIKAAEQAKENAKKNYTGLSNDEIQAEIQRRLNEQ